MHYPFMLYAIAADPSVGRIDKQSLSQQTLMELLIEGIENTENIFADPENLNDINKWEGLTFNADREVTVIQWPYRCLTGRISLEWMPSTVKQCYLIENDLEGSLDISSLPGSLEVFDVSCNRFDGTIDLTKLPEGMRRFDLSWNNFSGKTDFGHLPKSLQTLDVANTQLEGEIYAFHGNILAAKNSKVKDMRN